MAKIIGVLHGKERSFPEALVKRINEKNIKDISAAPVKIDKVIQGDPSGYAVIIDRISQDVPFYRAFLKNAAISGTAVINNPFWWSADEKFFNNALATKIGVPVPKTVILPSRELPDDTSAESFSNLAYPLDWKGIFDYVGFPAYMKPFAGGGWKNVYRLNDMNEFFEPRNPHHLRYVANFNPSAKMLKTMEDIVLNINNHLGYDFNTVELAIRDGIPYAIDFCNPAPDADLKSVGQENFDWVVETSANYAIEVAENLKEGADNLAWGEYIKKSAAGKPLTK